MPAARALQLHEKAGIFCAKSGCICSDIGWVIILLSAHQIGLALVILFRVGPSLSKGVASLLERPLGIRGAMVEAEDRALPKYGPAEAAY